VVGACTRLLRTALMLLLSGAVANHERFSPVQEAEATETLINISAPRPESHYSFGESGSFLSFFSEAPVCLPLSYGDGKIS